MSLQQAARVHFNYVSSRSPPSRNFAVCKPPSHHHQQLSDPLHQRPPQAHNSSRSPYSNVVPRSTAANGSAGNGSSDAGAAGSASGSSSSTNGSSPDAAAATPSSNGGGSSGGGGSTRSQTGQGPSDDGDSGKQQNPGFQLPLSIGQLSSAVSGLAAVSALLLIAVIRQAAVLSALGATSQTVVASLVSM